MDPKIRDFANIAEIQDAMEAMTRGIELGNDGDAFGLTGFEVIESSDQGMLLQVKLAMEKDSPACFR